MIFNKTKYSIFRSRFGKTLIPKNGLISNIVSAVQEGKIKNVLFVPVSFSYDKIVEGIYHDELMGTPKKRESIWMIIRGFFTSFSSVNKCGDVVLDIGKPVSLIVRYFLHFKF